MNEFEYSSLYIFHRFLTEKQKKIYLTEIRLPKETVLVFQIKLISKAHLFNGYYAPNDL